MQAIDELSILDQAVAESITDMGHELQEVLTAILVTDDQCAKAALTAREDRLVLYIATLRKSMNCETTATTSRLRQHQIEHLD